MATTSDITSTYFKIDALKGDNWFPYKRRLEALLTDRDLLGYINGETLAPMAADPQNPTGTEASMLKRWMVNDAKARSQIILTLSDAEMIHISGATTARQM
jgi:hypothetical protein